MTDRVLGRLSYEPSEKELMPIPWPEGLAPTLVKSDHWTGDPLVKVDVLVVTWTSAEWMALADVLSPGREKGEWQAYGRNWGEFEPHLTDRSPAKEAKCLGEYTYVTIADKLVCLFHSQLHMDTDDETVPLIALWQQLITEAQPELVIDTGTAGGIGASVVEGDTVVGQNLVFNCTGRLKEKPWAHESFACTYETASIDFSQAQELMKVNAGQLRPEATRDPEVWKADVITCDSFLFDAVGDPFGLETYDDGKALVEEMDAATLALACQNLTSGVPKFTSLRSVSDPQIPDLGSIEKEEQDASNIYEKYGYAAQCATLLAVWQVIVGLDVSPSA